MVKEGESIKYPESFIQAQEYYKELQKNPKWMAENDRYYVAITKREVIDRDRNVRKLWLRLNDNYSLSDVFIPFVEVNPRIQRIRPRGPIR